MAWAIRRACGAHHPWGIRIPLIIRFTVILLLMPLILHPRFCHGQQAYVSNNQLKCTENFTDTNGFLCNGPLSSCTAYLTFRSNPPYNTPPNIAFLLNADSSAMIDLNNISSVATLPTDDLLVVPVNCSCTRNRGFYQHNATYRLNSGDTYFSVANNTYQGLATCQALISQNPYGVLALHSGLDVLVPLMCACPSTNQTANGVKYLVSYLVTWGDSTSAIAEMFGVDQQSVLDANELLVDSLIYPFTPILVPVKSVPNPSKINLSPPPPPPPPPPPIVPTTKTGGSKKWVFVGIGIGAFLLVLALASFMVWFCRRGRKGRPVAVPPPPEKAFLGGKPRSHDHEYAAVAALSGSKGEDLPSSDSYSISTDGLRSAIESLTVYKYEELQRATDSFSEDRRIKGSVFRGSFKGDDAAVKIMEGDVSNEINILKKINHSNIIRLSGFCIHQGNTYLVYEYAEKGSLRDWIVHHKKRDKDGDFPVLGWKERVQIAYDMADALNYLHHYTNPPYIHKNFTSSNVLLDANLRAKITNFALARAVPVDHDDGAGEEGLQFTRHVVGTQGYLAPEFIENGVVTAKLDVFAFGIVLLELLSGRVAAGDGEDEEVLTASSIRRVFEGENNVREKLQRFMDGALGRQDYPLELAYSMAQLAHSCVSHDLNSRPSMAEILMALSKLHSSTLDWDPSDHSSSISIQVHTGGSGSLSL
ncbi:hypothetical protein Dimus_035051 [Dionaea muscipula]